MSHALSSFYLFFINRVSCFFPSGTGALDLLISASGVASITSCTTCLDPDLNTVNTSHGVSVDCNLNFKFSEFWDYFHPFPQPKVVYNNTKRPHFLTIYVPATNLRSYREGFISSPQLYEALKSPSLHQSQSSLQLLYLPCLHLELFSLQWVIPISRHIWFNSPPKRPSFDIGSSSHHHLFLSSCL